MLIAALLGVVEAYPAWPDRSTIPPGRLVADIDRKLDRRPCIGDIHRWERVYSFEAGWKRPDRYYRDFDRIHVSLKEAGRFGHSDRAIALASLEQDADSDGVRLEAHATYIWSRAKLKVDYCGPRIGE